MMFKPIVAPSISGERLSVPAVEFLDPRAPFSSAHRGIKDRAPGGAEASKSGVGATDKEQERFGFNQQQVTPAARTGALQDLADQARASKTAKRVEVCKRLYFRLAVPLR